MWLPETAVDLETLDIMAELGIRFTILAPNQAGAVRRQGQKKWHDVSDSSIDPRRAYQVALPSGRTMSLFFYDGPVSRSVAFENVLDNGEWFAERLMSLFSNGGDDEAQLAHMATDGETYGHHHRHGDMALAYALGRVEANEEVRLTNYGEFLELHPPAWEVRIIENSSWSCVHGVERWRGDCGCHTGGDSEWNQAWRKPLRDALDYLRDQVWPLYVEKAQEFFHDPSNARDDYIDVILNRSPESVGAFFDHNARAGLDDTQRTAALKLLEMQRHAMLMYTSCGWFFNDLSGIETVQVMQYAGRVIQLAHELAGHSIEPMFLERLQEAESNLPEHGDGRQIFEKFVRPAVVDLLKVGGHYGIASLFEDFDPRERVYCFIVDGSDHQRAEAGRTAIVVGRCQITSEITGESRMLTYGALHLGEHNLSAGVREFMGDDQYRAMVAEVMGTFERGELSEIIRLFERHFSGATYSLRTLFRDEQRRISRIILANALRRADVIQRDFYDTTLPMMRFLASVNIPIPSVFYSGAEFVVNSGLRAALEESDMEFDRVDSLLEEAEALDVKLDGGGLGFALRHNIERDMSAFLDDPSDVELLERLQRKASLVLGLPFEVDLWKVQNGYFTLRTGYWNDVAERASGGDADAERWMQHFRTLGDALRMQIE
jgi:hypothetical protein